MVNFMEREKETGFTKIVRVLGAKFLPSRRIVIVRYGWWRGVEMLTGQRLQVRLPKGLLINRAGADAAV
jgi:hypothetical protein